MSSAPNQHKRCKLPHVASLPAVHIPPQGARATRKALTLQEVQPILTPTESQIIPARDRSLPEYDPRVYAMRMQHLQYVAVELFTHHHGESWRGGTVAGRVTGFSDWPEDGTIALCLMTSTGRLKVPALAVDGWRVAE